MNKLLKISLITALATLTLVSCMFDPQKLKNASNEDIMKFIEAYSLASHEKGFDEAYDQLVTSENYSFEFDTTSTSDLALEIYKLFISEDLSEDESPSFVIKGFARHISAFYSNSKATPFVSPETGEQQYIFSFSLSDFAGPLTTDKVTIDSEEQTIGALLEKIFSNKVTVTIYGSDLTNAKPGFTVEGINLSTTDGVDKLSGATYKVLETIWNFLIAYEPFWESFSSNSPTLEDYSFYLECAKAISTPEDDSNIHFNEIKDSKFSLNAAITEETKTLIDNNSGTTGKVIGHRYQAPRKWGNMVNLYQNPYLPYLLNYKINAVAEFSATLDGEHYEYAYSTEEEILTINGKKYSCSVEKLLFAYNTLYPDNTSPMDGMD